MKPNGSRQLCPACQAALSAPPHACGETHCPRCNAWLWHLGLASGPTFFVRRSGETIYDLMADLTSPGRRLSASEIERTLRNADSIDVMEFLAGLEEPP